MSEKKYSIWGIACRRRHLYLRRVKKFSILCFILCSLNVTAQTDTAYSNLLNATSEVSLTDSVHINAFSWQPFALDSAIVKKWFSRILPSTNNNRLKNRNYFLAGKITSNTNFDLLLLLEEKKRADSTNVQIIHLISTKKDGTYIASLEVAVSGSRKKSIYSTSSWLYKDYQIIQDSKIIVNEQSYGDLTHYKINGGGRFILSPNY